MKTLWEPSSAAIQQVGLLEYDPGTVKFTIWAKSSQPWVEEGERIRVYKAARNWYDGRAHLAATGWTVIHFPDREDWLAE